MVGRALLVAVSLLVAAWLGATAVARDDADEGSRALAATRGSPGPALVRSDERYRRARRFGPDAALYVRQGAELLLMRQRQRAIPLLERAVRAEPRNAEAWLVLFAALRGRDAHRAAEARRRVLALDPRAEPVLGRLR